MAAELQPATERPFDRLDLLSAMLSLYYFTLYASGLASKLPLSAELLGPSQLVCMSLAVLGVISRHRFEITVLSAVIFVATFLLNSPVASNNQTMGCAISILFLASRIIPGGREERFEATARPGRYILATMYFFGIFHKLNVDWMDPLVGCGVVLYGILSTPFGLQDWWLGQQGAIWGTLIVEAIAMICLFIPHYKRLALIFGIPFHLAIGLTGYAFYMDFSTIVLATYTLFIGRETVQRFSDWLPRSPSLGLLLGCAIAAFAILGGVNGLVPVSMTDNYYRPFFLIYGIGFFMGAVILSKPEPFFWRPQPLLLRLAWVIPILYFLNGWAPYVGLRTEGTLSMYSNLHTEGGQSNHYLFERPLPLFDYQDEVVELEDGVNLIRWEYDRARLIYPNLWQRAGRAADEPNTYVAAGPLERAYLVFKTVDFDRPKVCTH
ncbi:MAG: hypothetical protein AAGH74_06885 [Pseudomonadota bacterium]